MGKKRVLIGLVAVVLLIIAGCSDNTVQPADNVSNEVQNETQTNVSDEDIGMQVNETEPVIEDEPDEVIEKKIETFHYQLQNIDYENLRTLDVDLLVIDIDDSGFNNEEVQGLKDSGKVVLSYLSIGEAEDYRGYWELDWRVGSPDFIDKENKEWKGNYKVKYWHVKWQEIMFDAVKSIAERGYDGAYLDIIDAYEYYELMERETARDEMVEFVGEIRKQARTVNPDFLIVPQNAPNLYERDDYREFIDGIGKEDTWYDDDDKADAEDRGNALWFLDKVIGNGKFVLAIDYPTKKSNICNFYEKCRGHKFACKVSDRDLTLDKPIVCS